MTPSTSRRRNRISSARIHVVAYWTTTGVLAAECFVGGVMGALRLQPFKSVITHLGYSRRLLRVGRPGPFGATPSPDQGVGICGPDFHLHRSDGFPYLGRR
jgi:hypothetical protein